MSRFTQRVSADESALESVKGAAGALARWILNPPKDRRRGFEMQCASEFTNMIRKQTGIGKVPHVASFVKMLLENGESVVLGGWHHAVYDIWRELLQDHKPAFYTGRESATAKNRARDSFVSHKTNLLILSIHSGIGLDGLQGACRNVVFGELDWSPAPHKQFIGRRATGSCVCLLLRLRYRIGSIRTRDAGAENRTVPRGR